MPSTLPLLVKIYAIGAPIQLGLGNQITNFTYEDVEEGDDLVKITFADPYHTLVDSEQFVENTEWHIQWGFAGAMYPTRKVLIKRPKVKYGEISIEGLDKGSNLKLEDRWDVVKNKSMEAHASDIAKRHGLTLDTDGTLSEFVPFFLYGGQTDWDVLRFFQSRLENHFFKVVNDKLVFKKRNLDQAPVASFDYQPGRNSRLLDYEVQVKDNENAKGSGQSTGVGIDPLSFKKNVFKSDESNTTTTNLGNRRPTSGYKTDYASNIASPRTAAVSGGTKTTSTQNNSTGKAIILPPGFKLDSTAKGKRNSALLEGVIGSFDIAADPKDPFFKNGDLIEVRGLGKKFSGMYRIAEVTHDLTDGYIIKIKGKRNAVNSTSSSAPAILNGSINKKIPQENFGQIIEKQIKGSITGAIYGTLGRAL